MYLWHMYIMYIIIIIYRVCELAEIRQLYLGILKREIERERDIHTYKYIYIWESVHIATFLFQSTTYYRFFEQLILLPVAEGGQTTSRPQLILGWIRAKSLGETWSNLASWVQTQSLRHVEQLLSHVWAIPTFQAVFLFVTLPNHTTVVTMAARYWLYKRDLAKAREHFYQVSMMLTFCRSADRSGWGVQWDCEKWWKMDIWWE